ncbi:SPX domain-containing protein [Artemisia annua]|uniref:SPX domain-containing protein n=1 Tax=Artemisia annua TaxID=35608 RepID=A0A2U1M2X8_ARTAN|nr:SPX domain-containing protein [Artemisia annua]
MQFRKVLQRLIDEMLPEWRDKFLSYKVLKKQLKRIYFSNGNKRQKMSVSDESVAKEVDEFVSLCKDETHKFNDFVLEKQEWYIIRIKVLEDNLDAAKDSNDELLKVGRELVDLHGEIVLLLNYSALNYTGLVKILKKHDKLSGALIRVPFIQQVLNEPFYKTDVLNNLVKKCETMLDQLFSMNERQLSPCASPNRKEDGSDPEPEDKSSLTVPEDLVDIKNMENTYMRLTLSALTVLKEIRSGSSTVNGRVICLTWFEAEGHRDHDTLRSHEESLVVTQELQESSTHLHLKSDLIERIWRNRRNQVNPDNEDEDASDDDDDDDDEENEKNDQILHEFFSVNYTAYHQNVDTSYILAGNGTNLPVVFLCIFQFCSINTENHKFKQTTNTSGYGCQTSRKKPLTGS